MELGFWTLLDNGILDSKAQGCRMLSIQPKILEILVGTQWNGPFQFGPPRYSGPALKVVLFDWSGHFSWLDQSVPFHLKKLLPPVPLFCILLTRTITKCAVAWVRSVQPTWPWNFGNFKSDFLLNGKHPRIPIQIVLLFCLNNRAKCMLYVLRHPTSCIAYLFCLNNSCRQTSSQSPIQ